MRCNSLCMAGVSESLERVEESEKNVARTSLMLKKCFLWLRWLS